jgi:hypothetical protein
MIALSAAPMSSWGGRRASRSDDQKRGSLATDELVLSLSSRHVMQDGGHRVKHPVVALPEAPWRTISVPIKRSSNRQTPLYQKAALKDLIPKFYHSMITSHFFTPIRSVSLTLKGPAPSAFPPR